MRLYGIGLAIACALTVGSATAVDGYCSEASPVIVEHGGGLNACGCHFNRKTGE